MSRNPLQRALLSASLLSLSLVVPGTSLAQARFQRGDATGDAALNITDPLRILEFLFLGGGELGCLDAADADDSGAVDLVDSLAILRHLFLDGQAIPAPGASCGVDPTADALDCERYGPCKQPSFPFETIDGFAVIEGDIVLGPVDEVIASLPEEEELALFSLSTKHYGERWPDGLLPYELGTAPNPGLVLDAIEHWREKTPIRFVERTEANASSFPNYVRFVSGSGCFSSVGMQKGEQRITLSAACSFGNIVHEIGHTLGLEHEQNRGDRDLYVDVIEENIDDSDTARFQFEKRKGLICGPYDYGSIMHYGASFFNRDGCGCNTIETIPPGTPIGQRNALSEGDIWTIRNLYSDIINSCVCAQSLATGSPPAIGRPGARPFPPGSLPDLEVLDFATRGAMKFPPAGGFRLPVRIEIGNLGQRLADPFRIVVRLVSPSGAGVKFLPDSSATPEVPRMCLPPEEATVLLGDVLFPDSFLGGSASIDVVVDDIGEVDELDERNNRSQSITVSFPGECFNDIVQGKPVRICFTPPPPPQNPDLTVARLTHNGVITPRTAGGFTAPIRVTVTNRGEGPSPAFEVSVFEGSRKWGAVTTAGLAAGASRAVTVTATFPDSLRGETITLRARADSAAAVAETNESNNVSAGTVRFTLPGQCQIITINGKPERICF